MTALNGFCSFAHNMESLYWGRICSVMAQKASISGDKSKIHTQSNLIFSQPFGGSLAKEGKYICVFSGEITNYKTVKEKLGDMGIKAEENFASVFLNIYKVLGIRGEGLVFGEFNALVWDGEKGRLILFRDKAGTKPMYYAYVNKRFAFSSSVNALLRFPGVYAHLDAKGIYNMLASGDSADPFSTPFVNIKRIPAGCVAEFTGDGVRIKSYYSLNPSDKFNSEFIARDAIRLRGGKEFEINNEKDSLQTIISALDTVDWCSFPVYMPVYAFLPAIKKEGEEKLSFPYLPPEFPCCDLSFLLKDEILKGIKKINTSNNFSQSDILGMSVYFDDEIKVSSAGKIKLKINTSYSLWWEAFDRYAQMCRKEITLPLADARFLECVTDGGGKSFVYNKEVFLPCGDYVRKILLNELGRGNRAMFNFIDKEKLFDYIYKTEDVLSLLYILQLDYWTLKFKVTF